MIPAVLAILIYQILAILGAEAVSQIVTAIAYKRRNLDYKLMYLQSPLDMVMNYNRFNHTTLQKATIVLFACLAIALKFIPTILTKFNASASIYYDATTAPLDPTSAVNTYKWPSTLPVFDSFIPYLTQLTDRSLEDMTNAYIKDTLRLNNTQNSGGHWFTPNISKRYEWNNQQVATEFGFMNRAPTGQGAPSDGSLINTTILAFAFDDEESSLTMQRCDPSIPTNLITNISQIHGNIVQAARRRTAACVPIYDNTLRIEHQMSNGIFTSLLNINDTLYRLPTIPQGVSASSSFGVSIFNHNNTHMTMAIKKTAHITLYALHTNATFPLDCAIGNKPNFANNFIDLPYDAVLCDLINAKETLNRTANIIQAAGRSFQENYAINTVYTYERGQRDTIIMIDLALFQAFNVEGHLQANEERMVAFSRNSLSYTLPLDIADAVNLAHDKIGTLLKTLDPSRIDQNTVDIMVGMASMRVRWDNGDLSDFSVNTSQVMDAIQTPAWWIITVSVMAVLFLAPHLSRLVVRRIPEYADNLRNLLLITVERSHVLEKGRSTKEVGILLSAQDDKQDCIALLSVNEYPVTIAEKLTSVEVSLINERTSTEADEKLGS